MVKCTILSKYGKLKKLLCGRSFPGKASKIVEIINQIIAGINKVNFIEERNGCKVNKKSKEPPHGPLLFSKHTRYQLTFWHKYCINNMYNAIASVNISNSYFAYTTFLVCYKNIFFVKHKCKLPTLHCVYFIASAILYNPAYKFKAINFAWNYVIS